MKFIVSSSVLLKQLSKIAGIVPVRPVVPIIENILFDVDGGTLVLSSTNLDVSMQAQVSIKSEGGAMKIAVPAKPIVDILKALPDQSVSFAIDEVSFAIEISSSNGAYSLKGENGSDFPKIPNPTKAKSAQMPAKALLKAISKTLFAVSDDQNQPALSGLYFIIGEDTTTFVACDGHRLVRYRLDGAVSESVGSFIVPRKSITVVKAAFDGTAEDIHIEHDASNAFFRTGSLLLVCRLVDALYPNYEGLIPMNDVGRLTVGRDDLRGGLARAAIFANKYSNHVRLTVSSSGLAINAEDINFAMAAKEAIVCTYEGEGMEIGFNSDVLRDTVSNIIGEEVLIKFFSPKRPTIVLPIVQEPGEDILMLAMASPILGQI